MADLINLAAAKEDMAINRLLIFSASLTISCIAVLPKLPNKQNTIPLASLGASISAIAAYCRCQKDKDTQVYKKLQQTSNDNLVADLVSAIELTESRKIKEKLTIDIKNSQARLSEWGE